MIEKNGDSLCVFATMRILIKSYIHAHVHYINDTMTRVGDKNKFDMSNGTSKEPYDVKGSTHQLDGMAFGCSYVGKNG